MIKKIEEFNMKSFEERFNHCEDVFYDEDFNLCKSRKYGNCCYQIKPVQDFVLGRNQCRKCKANRKKEKNKFVKISEELNSCNLDDFDKIMENDLMFYVGKLKTIKKLLST